MRGGLTYGDHQEAYVTEPVRCLVGQLLHKEPQDGAEVTLVACHRHLHRRRCLCVAVTAAGIMIFIRRGGMSNWEKERVKDVGQRGRVREFMAVLKKDSYLSRVFPGLKPALPFLRARFCHVIICNAGYVQVSASLSQVKPNIETAFRS